MKVTDRQASVGLYVGVVVALGIAAGILSVFLYPPDLPDLRMLVGLLVFACVGVGLELAEHKLAVGAASGSIAFIVYIAASLVFGPTWCVTITASSLSVAHLTHRRPPIRILFNVSQNVLALVSGAIAYQMLGGTFPAINLDVVTVPFAGLAAVYLLINSSAVSGVIALSEGRQFSEVWLRNTWSLLGYDLVASAFALGIAWVYLEAWIWGVAGVVIPILFLRHTYRVNLQLQDANRDLLEVMVKAIEARDPYTSGHSQRVAALARALSKELGLGFREVEQIATAALLHDVGKIYEEFAPILRKQGPLTEAERTLMQTHAIRSAELVSGVSNLRGYVEQCVRHHHENFDGTGYPAGLAGDEIPRGARIIMVADTTDAMITDRPYRKAMDYATVVSELDRNAGRQFDPRVVQAFKRGGSVRTLVESFGESAVVAHAHSVEERRSVFARHSSQGPRARIVAESSG